MLGLFNPFEYVVSQYCVDEQRLAKKVIGYRMQLKLKRMIKTSNDSIHYAD